MPSTTLILGGGFGGIRCANELRSLLPKEHRVVLIDSQTIFYFGVAKTWIAIGEAEPKQVMHSLVPLKKKGIEVEKATVTRIDAASRKVETDRGIFTGDYLVIALGADTNMGAIPGLASAAKTFYTLDGAIELRDVLAKFSGGDVVFLIPRTPFKCPPGPYEGAFLIYDLFKKRGVLDRSKLSFCTVEGSPMATAGPDIGKFIVEQLTKRNIAFNNLKRTVSVDAASRKVKFEDGSGIGYDLLIAVPPHEAPKVVRESGLTNASGWIPAEPMNLRVAAHENVYAIGDVAVVPLPGRFKPDMPLILPKAGTLADREAEVVAKHIAASVLGKSTDSTFDGKGFCYIETGDMHAVRGEGSFFELPNPTMQRRIPDMTQFQEKKAWVENWLKENL
jgi:sulfide:quinone oxidoreductase